MIILVARGRERGRGRGRGKGKGKGRGTKGAGSSDAGSSGAGSSGARSSSDLRRSSRVKEKGRFEDEIEEEEEEEELLSSSQQIAFQPSTAEQSLSKQIASQPSSAEQSLPQQSSSQQSSTQQSSTQQSSSQQSFSQGSFSLKVNLDPLIIDPTDNRDIIIRRSRCHTPIIGSENMSPTGMQQSQRSTPSVEIPPNRVLSDDRLISPTGIQQSSVKIPPNRVLSDDRLISSTGIQQPSVKILPNRDDRLTNIEAILIKQGKQNRAIYDLQKVTLEKVSLLQAQVKKIKSEKSNELSQKVFNVSNNLICIILSH
jgi:flagellar biosynthesis GTPase FlhF